MPVGLGLLAGAGTLLGGLFNSISSRNTSRRNVDKTIAANRQLAEYQYSKDVEMWNRQNQYNSPQQQMLRLKSAGLNPNLIYGSKGAVGNTAAQTPKYQNYNPQHNAEPFQLDLASSINMYQDFKVKGAQVNNLKAMNENIMAKTLSETAKTAEIKTKTAKTGYEYQIARKLEKNTLQVAEKNLEMMNRNIDFKNSQLKETTARTAGLKLDNELKKVGLQPGDASWMRLLFRHFNKKPINRNLGIPREQGGNVGGWYDE